MLSRSDPDLAQSENELGDFFYEQNNLELATEHYENARENYVAAFGETCGM